jgi:GTPase Era involved in 16S rRNA processing
VERAAGLAAECGRADLLQRMRARQAVLADPAVTVMVVGEYKQGKSSLINALLSAPVCPVDDDVATAVPTVIRFSEQARAAVAGGDDPYEAVWTEVPIDEARRTVLDGGPAVAGRRRVVEIGLPRRLLADGLVVVDTPGVGGIGSVHAAATASALPAADAILFVSDASQELTAPELEFLSATRRLCATSCLVLTKIDLYPEWRSMLEADQEHLARAGTEQEVAPS